MTTQKDEKERKKKKKKWGVAQVDDDGVRIPSTTFSACHKKKPTRPNLYTEISSLLLFVIIIYSPAMRVIVFGLTYVCVHATCEQEKI